MEYVKHALFIWDENSEHNIEKISANPHKTAITAVHYDKFCKEPEKYLEKSTHIVASISEERLENLFNLAMLHHFSLGLVPLNTQKYLAGALNLPLNVDESIDIALQNNMQAIDLVRCNDQTLISKAVMGWLPLLDTQSSKKSLKQYLFDFYTELKKLFTVNLIPFEIETANGKKIKTAASGVIVLHHQKSSMVSKLSPYENSLRDGMISIIIFSPFSVFEYIKFLFIARLSMKKRKTLPTIIGYIRSSKIEIKPQKPLKADIDSYSSSSTPLVCEVIRDALLINAPESFWEDNPKSTTVKEAVKVDNLPNEKEIPKYSQKHIPLLSYASEERFKDLFQSLREDAKTNSTYLTLMTLSTILASIGLLLNSTSVVIGAMLLAPLMAPIVSLAMGILRGDENLLKASTAKIAIGVVTALISSVAVIYIIPLTVITNEIISRTNPTLLDLGVAIVSGIAAAYSKSFKEIVQSLAGVAIAVALVPPLAVAGIGLGMGEIYIFIGAFLLFLTNLVGIILSATFTFQILGYSSVLKSKKSFLFVSLLLAAISFPLYLSYNEIYENHKLSLFMKQERYLINGKYIIINDADIRKKANMLIINLHLSAREQLTRSDLGLLKKKIQSHTDRKVYIKAKIDYIL